MPFMDFLGDIGDLAGKAFDFLDDNEWLGETITRLIAENPEMDYDKIIDLALTQAKMNAANINTPSGSTTTEFDPVTGQPTVTQTYTPEVQELFNMLVRNAGATPDTYHAPRNFDAMMGKYINDREQHMGLPLTDYDPWRSSSPGGASFPSVPTSTGTMTKTNNVEEGTADYREGFLDPIRDRGARDPARADELAAFIDWGVQNNRFDGADQDFNAILNDYIAVAPQGTDPGALEQFLVEHGKSLGGLAGSLSGAPMGGTIGRYLASHFIDNYWDNNQWASPADNPDGINEGLANALAESPFNMESLGAQQSPAFPEGRLRPVEGYRGDYMRQFGGGDGMHPYTDAAGNQFFCNRNGDNCIPAPSN